MAVSRNIRDFTDLVCECLSAGWRYRQGPPSEDELCHWVTLGRAPALFHRPVVNHDHVSAQTLHLIRGKDAGAVLAGYRRVYRAGLWTAWIEDHHRESLRSRSRYPLRSEQV